MLRRVDSWHFLDPEKLVKPAIFIVFNCNNWYAKMVEHEIAEGLDFRP